MKQALGAMLMVRHEHPPFRKRERAANIASSSEQETGRAPRAGRDSRGDLGRAAEDQMLFASLSLGERRQAGRGRQGDLGGGPGA